MPMVFMWSGNEWQADSQHEVDAILARYVLESKSSLGKSQYLSVAIDKGTPAKVPMYNSVLCVPSNLAVVGVPQVFFVMHTSHF